MSKMQLDELLERCMGNVHLVTRLIKKCQECFDEELPELRASGATASTMPIVPPFRAMMPTIPPSRREKTTICVCPPSVSATAGTA